MKKVLFVLALSIAVGSVQGASQTWEIYQGDTVNYTDANGKKQGHWIYWYTTGGQIKEEGEYQNSRKEGLWKKYYPEGAIWSEITYKSNKAAGPYITYFENGNKEEEGEFYASGKGKTVGDFTRWFEDGTISQEKHYNDDGASDGPQTIYYENGQVAVEWTASNGVETGTLTRFWENGNLKEVIEYDADGNITDQKPYAMTDPAVVIKDEPEYNVQTTVPTDVQTNGGNNFASTGLPDGNQKLYNSDYQISQDGYFEGGRLKKGKIYIYNSDGLLERIEMYDNFKYIGNGVIEDD